MVRVLGWVVAGLLVVELALVQAPMWLTRWRDARLLADFHTIVPMQSTWADAQRLMTRWGRFGKYEGSCAAAECSYSVTVNDPATRLLYYIAHRWEGKINPFSDVSLLTLMGWRGSEMKVRIVVKDGRVIRDGVSFWVDVRYKIPKVDPYDSGLMEYALGFTTQVRNRLRRPRSERGMRWILGTDEQLDDHPDYKVGRPGGCEGCEIAEMTFTPALDHAEAVRLTSFDLSCLTRLRQCTTIGDLLPAGRDWQLYDGDRIGPHPSGGLGPIACRTMPRAIGRDADVLLEVEALTAIFRRRGGEDDALPSASELDTGRVLRVVKGASSLKVPEPGEVVKLFPFPGSEQDHPAELAEHLIAGRRYFVVLTDDRGGKGVLGSPRCGVVEDTPSNLQQLSIGIAQDVEANEPTGWEE